MEGGRSLSIGPGHTYVELGEGAGGPRRLLLLVDILVEGAGHLVRRPGGAGYTGNYQRGSGVLSKGQRSWNISVTKEARVDQKVVLEPSMKCPSRGIFSPP